MTNPLSVTLHPSPFKRRVDATKAAVIPSLRLPEPVPHSPVIDLEKQARSANQKAAAYAGGGASVAPLASSQKRALQKIESYAQCLKVADQAGVQLARATFMSKLLGAGICTVAVGVAAALTGVSFGVGAALLAVASVRLAVAVGDAACAYKAYKDACATPPRKTLPLGANSLGNLLHATAFRGEKDTHERVRKATLVSGAVTVGLAAAGTALSLGAAAPDAVGRGLRLGCSALLGVMWRRDSNFADSADTASASMRQARRDACDAIKNVLSEQRPDSLEGLKAVIAETPALGAYSEKVGELLSDAANPAYRESLAPVANRAIANTTREVTYATLLSGPGIGFLLKALA